MTEEFQLIGNIYFLNKDYMIKFANSKNMDFLFLLKEFYAESSFLEFYLIILEKMKDTISKSNLLFSLGDKFSDLNLKIRGYIQYLRDGNEFSELEKENLLEYEIFREVLRPFIDDILYNNKVDEMMKLLEIFEKMLLSPDQYVQVLLRDTVIEGGWLEKENSLEKYMEDFGDNFLTWYALVYDGRIFLKNEKIWEEVKKRKLKI